MKIFEYGDDAGIPLVLFGGTPQKGDAFAELDGMAGEAGIRLICPTRPWYDDRGAAPSFHAVTGPLLAYLEAHGLPSVHVMGGSGGGPFAFHVATVAPQSVVTCTLLASMGMPGSFAQRVSSPPTVEILKAFGARDYRGWMETTSRWGLSEDLGHGAWGDFLVYFDELPRIRRVIETPILVYQSESDPNAPLESVREMLDEASAVTWHVGERAGHIAMARDPGAAIMREIFGAIRRQGARPVPA